MAQRAWQEWTEGQVTARAMGLRGGIFVFH
jgi:hypothetical protein